MNVCIRLCCNRQCNALQCNAIQSNPIQFHPMKCDSRELRFVSEINAFAYAQKYVIKQVECGICIKMVSWHTIPFDCEPTLDNLFVQHTKSEARATNNNNNNSQPCAKHQQKEWNDEKQQTEEKKPSNEKRDRHTQREKTGNST